MMVNNTFDTIDFYNGSCSKFSYIIPPFPARDLEA